MKNAEYPEDELGLTEEQFETEQKKREAENANREREFWARPKRYFFIFETRAERDAALAEISQAREYSEVFLQLDDWKKDSKREEVGLQMSFKHGQEGLREKLKSFFANLKYQDRKFQIQEDYAPDDIEGAVGGNVVMMPKRGEAEEQRKTA